MPKQDRRDYDEPFYESLQATFDHYEPAADEDLDDKLLSIYSDNPDQSKDDGRLTAILTLALVALVAIILGVLFLRGLDTIKSSAPTQSQTSSQGAP